MLKSATKQQISFRKSESIIFAPTNVMSSPKPVIKRSANSESSFTVSYTMSSIFPFSGHTFKKDEYEQQYY